MNISKSGFEGFPHSWWMRSGHMWRRCWKWVISTLVKAHGVMQSCWEPSGSGTLLLLGPEAGFLANSNGKSIEAVHCFHFGKPRIFLMWIYAIWAVQCPSHISEIHAELHKGSELNILPNLLEQCASLLKDEEGAHTVLTCCVQLLLGTQPEVKTHKVWILLE